MQLLAVLVLVTLIFLIATFLVHWEDRRAQRRQAARVQSALIRIGELPQR